jgi:hypothetical protein
MSVPCACSKPHLQFCTGMPLAFAESQSAKSIGVRLHALRCTAPPRNTAHLTPHTVGRRPRLSLAIASFCSSLYSQPTSLWLGLTAARSLLNPTPHCQIA